MYNIKMETIGIILAIFIGVGIVIFSDYFRHLQMKKLANQLGLQYTFTPTLEDYSFRYFFTRLDQEHYIRGKYKNREVLIFDRPRSNDEAFLSHDKLVTCIYIDNELKDTLNSFITPGIKTIKKHLDKLCA